MFLERFITDVTGRKLISERLKQSEQKFRSIIEHLPDAVVIHSEGKFLFVNPAALKLVGVNSFDEIKDIPIMNFVHPDYQSIVAERLKLALISNSPVPLIEEKFIRLNGEIV